MNTALPDLSRQRAQLGRMQEQEDLATLAPMRGMAATFGRPGPSTEGDPVPPGWYTAYCLPAHPLQALGEDGRPLDTGVLPPMPFPRCMHAGTRVSFHTPLRIGDVLVRTNTFSALQAREGRSGPVILTTQTRRLHTPRGLALTEEYDLAFLPAQAAVGAPAPAPQPAGLPPATWTRTITPHPVTLFRYSALTFNPHRIHYDQAYAREVEGLPERVVQGGYTAQCLLDLAVDHLPQVRCTAFRFRAQAPLFVNQPVLLHATHQAQEQRVDLWALAPSGAVAVQAAMQYEATP